MRLVPPAVQEDALDTQVYRTVKEAAKRFFLPEFMNRIDWLIAFRFLSEESLRRILDLEIYKVQCRILSLVDSQFQLSCSAALKEHLLKRGTDRLSGARKLARVIDRKVTSQVSSLLASGQVEFGDFVRADYDAASDEVVFDRLARKRDAAAFLRAIENTAE